MQRIKKGDDVVVIAGRDKGKRGSVTRVMPDGRLIVSDVNMAKRHTKPNPNRGEQGGIIDKDMPIDASNVMIVCPDCGPTVHLHRAEAGSAPPAEGGAAIGEAAELMASVREEYSNMVEEAVKQASDSVEEATAMATKKKAA